MNHCGILVRISVRGTPVTFIYIESVRRQTRQNISLNITYHTQMKFYFQNFFSKRSFRSNPLKRTKSVTKLERKRVVDGEG